LDHDAFYAIGNFCRSPSNSSGTNRKSSELRRHYPARRISYGDYLPPGHRAFFPGDEVRRKIRHSGGMVLGVCNGFQILCEAGLLPGAMMRIAAMRYQCRPWHIRVDRRTHRFTNAAGNGQILKIPIAHSDGNYNCDDATLAELEKNRQVIFRYTTPTVRDDNAGNPSVSQYTISAGIWQPRGVPSPDSCPIPNRAVESRWALTTAWSFSAPWSEALVGRSQGDRLRAAQTCVFTAGARYSASLRVSNSLHRKEVWHPLAAKSE